MLVHAHIAGVGMQPGAGDLVDAMHLSVECLERSATRAWFLLAVVILNASEANRIFQLWVESKAAKYEAPSQSILTMVL